MAGNIFSEKSVGDEQDNHSCYHPADRPSGDLYQQNNQRAAQKKIESGDASRRKLVVSDAAPLNHNEKDRNNTQYNNYNIQNRRIVFRTENEPGRPG